MNEVKEEVSQLEYEKTQYKEEISQVTKEATVLETQIESSHVKEHEIMAVTALIEEKARLAEDKQ
jgi:hypothetical protein